MRGNLLSWFLRFAVCLPLAVSHFGPLCKAQFSGEPAPASSALSVSQSQLIQPDALNRFLTTATHLVRR